MSDIIPVCVALVLLGIIIVGCQYDLTYILHKANDWAFFVIGFFFISFGSWGIMKENKNRDLIKQGQYDWSKPRYKQ